MLPREYGVSVTRPWNSISLIPNSRFPFDLWARRKKDRGSCRVKSTLHSPFRSLYRGKNAGHGARCIARCIDAFNFHECTGRFPLRHATIFMIQWAKRWIKFRFGTLVSKPPYLPLSPSTMNCCCSFVVAKKKKEFKRKFNSPCFSWKRNKRIFRMYVVDKEDERGIWLSESKFSLITSNLR